MIGRAHPESQRAGNYPIKDRRHVEVIPFPIRSSIAGWIECSFFCHFAPEHRRVGYSSFFPHIAHSATGSSRFSPPFEHANDHAVESYATETSGTPVRTSAYTGLCPAVPRLIKGGEAEEGSLRGGAALNLNYYRFLSP